MQKKLGEGKFMRKMIIFELNAFLLFDIFYKMKKL